MSFYIGFASKDLVILAADRKFHCHGKPDIEGCKLSQLRNNTWAVHIGPKDFGEKWIGIFSHIRPMRLINTHGDLKRISRYIRAYYGYYQQKMERRQVKVEGFANIAIAGFRKRTPFIYAMDSMKDFHPELCSDGAIYSCVEPDEGKLDLYVKSVIHQLRLMQKESVNEQKTFLRPHIAKVFTYLSEKHNCISSAGDMVFITREGSKIECFNV